MSDHIKFDIVDKSVRFVKASKNAAKDLIRTTSYQITDRTNDFYDTDPNFAENVAKQKVSHNVYAARSTYRLGRSVHNVPKKQKAKKQYLEDFVKQKSEEWKKEHKHASQDEIEEKEQEFLKLGKKELRKEKKEVYQKNNIKPGLDIKSSSRRMIYNQSRKTLNRVKNKDFNGKVIGTSAKGLYYVTRYRQAIVKMAKRIVHFATHIFSHMISMASSIIGLFVAILTSLPLLIIFMIIIIVISSVFSYSGRIAAFVDNEVYLEYRYQANVAPDEILSITETLRWTDEDKEDYEALFSLLMDGKDEDWNISYDQMLDNVFNKYNPAKYAWQDNTIKVYRNVGGVLKTRYLTKEDYLALFPEYRDKKDKYGTEETIAAMKKEAHQLLEDNGQKYANHFFDESQIKFKNDPLKMDEIKNHAATYKVGFRSFMDGAFHGGADIAASEGTNVYAVMDGDVIASFNTASAGGDVCTDKRKQSVSACGLNYAGNQVVIRHAITDRRTDTPAFLYVAYFHLQKGSVNLKLGDHVSAGDVIGKVGNTGMSFGGHLHFQSWIDFQSRYQLPSTANDETAIKSNQNTIDPTMLCSIKFRNYIYGR